MRLAAEVCSEEGLGKSVQKLGFLPEAQNDMIFSIICEELGLIGAGFIILLFLILIWRFFVIATKASDLLGALIAAGAMAHMMIQVILNIAVVTNSAFQTQESRFRLSVTEVHRLYFFCLEMGLVLKRIESTIEYYRVYDRGGIWMKRKKDSKREEQVWPIILVVLTGLVSLVWHCGGISVSAQGSYTSGQEILITERVTIINMDCRMIRFR